jgi:hypothetical protein
MLFKTAMAATKLSAICHGRVSLKSVLHDIVSSYYARPTSWNEIGFGGQVRAAMCG